MHYKQLLTVKKNMYLCIIGDINGRVVNDNTCIENIMGKHGEIVNNNNGIRLIDFCIINNLVVLNTIYQQRKYINTQD